MSRRGPGQGAAKVVGQALLTFTLAARVAWAQGSPGDAVGSPSIYAVSPLAVQLAAPVPTPPRPSAWRWTGLHLGGTFGYGVGQTQGTLFAPTPSSYNEAFGSLHGGVFAGYDYLLPHRILIGVEADVAFPDFIEDGVIGDRSIAGGAITEKLDFVSTVRARVGYAPGRWLFYGTGGFAWGLSRFLFDPTAGNEAQSLQWRVGWSVGAGAEVAIAPGWSLRLEYLFDHLGSATARFPAAGGAVVKDASTDVEVHDIRVGVAWHPDWSGPGPTADLLEAPSVADSTPWFNFHGQFTFIEQGYPSFHSPYAGANSLPGQGEAANTATATLFLGVRLWRGAEFFFNPELDQGSGIGGTVGIAGFPNGEAQKAGYPIPRFNYDRLFVRQTVNLGGAQESVGDTANQFAGTRDVSRLTITFGKLSVGDLFDVNAYANDPRTQFMNWNVFGGGSFDWTMDKPGWTWGAAVELNQPGWAVRAGYFLVPVVSNSNTFDLNIPEDGEYDLEFEVPYARETHPGKLRLFGWVNRANMGSYTAALAEAPATPGYPDITLARQVRTNWGLVANLEQSLADDIGLFSRASWSPGLDEIIGWTDCDWSASLGAVMQGKRWRRPDDRLGLATVIEGLSPQAQAYFAAGGMGILIGDGHLTYRPEQVVEVYYAATVLPWLTLSADYQFVANPAYNAARGPVSIFAGRLHAEF